MKFLAYILAAAVLVSTLTRCGSLHDRAESLRVSQVDRIDLAQ